MELTKINKLKSGVYLVETREGMRLFNVFKEAQEFAKANNAVIVCGGGR